MANKFACVVVGFGFNVDSWNNEGEKGDGEYKPLREFVNRYKVNLPADYKSGVPIPEVKQTQMAVFALNDRTNFGVTGNQDGGNGAGGDAGGSTKHWFAGLETPASFSFWKIDSNNLKVWKDGEIGNPEYGTGKSVGNLEVKQWREAGADPGCSFFFEDIDSSYVWLRDTNPGGGSRMYDLYGKVVIIAVNATNP